jgi:hypothetical protein
MYITVSWLWNQAASVSRVGKAPDSSRCVGLIRSGVTASGSGLGYDRGAIYDSAGILD